MPSQKPNSELFIVKGVKHKTKQQHRPINPQCDPSGIIRDVSKWSYVNPLKCIKYQILSKITINFMG
jgi:hypothetical protein